LGAALIWIFESAADRGFDDSTGPRFVLPVTTYARLDRRSPRPGGPPAVGGVRAEREQIAETNSSIGCI